MNSKVYPIFYKDKLYEHRNVGIIKCTKTSLGCSGSFSGVIVLPNHITQFKVPGFSSDLFDKKFCKELYE